MTTIDYIPTPSGERYETLEGEMIGKLIVLRNEDSYLVGYKFKPFKADGHTFYVRDHVEAVRHDALAHHIG